MKIKKIKDVKTPTRGTNASAGLDFYVPEGNQKMVLPNESILIPSGIIAEVPKGYALIAYNKSGVATKKNLAVGASVVDEDYQGEIHFHLTNVGKQTQFIAAGEKIIQFLLVSVFYDTVEVVDEIHQEKTDRGEGGFGSTGNGLQEKCRPDFLYNELSKYYYCMHCGVSADKHV